MYQDLQGVVHQKPRPPQKSVNLDLVRVDLFHIWCQHDLSSCFIRFINHVDSPHSYTLLTLRKPENVSLPWRLPFFSVLRVEVIASRVEAMTSRVEAMTSRVLAIASRWEVIASRVETIASRLEVIARRVEAIASRVEAMAVG